MKKSYVGLMVIIIMYLNSFYLATITHIERMNNKQEDDGLKYIFAGVAKNKSSNNNLRA